MASKQLTSRQAAFVQEYLIDLNAAAAARRAGYSPKTANRIAAENLSKPVIADAIAAAQAERAERTQVTADQVLERLWSIATADARELSRVRRSPCRYCHGKHHHYQWVSKAEYAAALKQWETDVERAEEKELPAPPRPSDDGGYGYTLDARPNPACPACLGEGNVDVVLADSNDLSPAAALLYEGAKYTRTGIEVSVQNQMHALELVGKHLGMFTDRVDVTTDGKPFKAYIGFDPDDV